VFGRYPKAEDIGNEYPVIDLVICHGDFLNADHEYIHKNRNVKGFGSYGDIMIRDRKMYVAPTPFAVAQGLTGTRTLLVPASWKPPHGFKTVGDIIRVEATQLVVGYEFDLKRNEIAARTITNPFSGREHRFVAYRVAAIPGEGQDPVTTTPSGLPFRKPPCENPLRTETIGGLRIRGCHVSCCPQRTQASLRRCTL
jgi:hypothetical protein